MITNREAFPLQFEKQINKMYMKTYIQQPKLYPIIAKEENFPTGRYYREGEISGLGPFIEIPEHGGLVIDSPVEGHEKVVQTTKYGNGYEVTPEAVQDELFGKLNAQAATLAKGANQNVEINFWNLLNNGNGSATSWDGVSIFGAHTTLKSGDTITNKGTAALSETALQAAFEYFQLLKDEAGMEEFITPDLLVVPTQLQWVAARLAKQMGGITIGASDTASSSGNIMTVNPDYGIVDNWQYKTIRYLTASDAWFLMSKKDADLRIYWKQKAKLYSSDNFNTGSAIFKNLQRYVAFCMSYKGMYGSFPT